MVGGIFEAIFGSGTAFAGWFVEVVETLVTLFWKVPEGGGTGELTFIGGITLVFLLVKLTKFAIGWVRSLVKK